MEKEFILLKKTFPISKYDRECNGYKYFIDNTTIEQRKEWGINDESLKKIILKNEKYIYQVGNEGGKFKVLYSSFENYELIRKYIFGVADDI
jgi:hypothetical protein